MNRILSIVFIIGIATYAAQAIEPSSRGDGNWPRWRGPLDTGVAPDANPPTEWSETENLRWKVRIPGLGHAAPIIWNNRVYIMTAVKTNRPAAAGDTEAPAERRRGRGKRPPTNVFKFVVMSLDRKTGRTVWESTAIEAVPHEAGHHDATQASSSPITDGKHIYAHFGSRGLFCLDMQGKILWQKDLGDMQTRNNFGEGSSPALHGNTIVVNWDHEGDSFIVALDKNSGSELWRVDRDEPTSWSTPVIVEDGGRPVVVVSATNFVRAYDLKTGELIWKCSGMTANTIPTPVVGDGLLYAVSGFRGNALLAIRYAGARGDLTHSKRIVWSFDKHTPYVPSPLLYGDALYFLENNRSILSCLDSATGKPYYTQQRLDGVEGVYASPVGAGGHVYIPGRNGATAVLKRGTQYDVVSVNKLDDGIDASPAIAGDELYLRGREHLYCIAK